MRRKWITRFTFERVDRRTTCKGVRSKNLTIWSTERVRIFLEGICISVVIVLERILRKLQSRISSLARKGVIFTGKGITNIVIKITGPPGIINLKKPYLTSTITWIGSLLNPGQKIFLLNLLWSQAAKRYLSLTGKQKLEYVQTTVTDTHRHKTASSASEL